MRWGSLAVLLAALAFATSSSGAAEPSALELEFVTTATLARLRDGSARGHEPSLHRPAGIGDQRTDPPDAGRRPGDDVPHGRPDHHGRRARAPLDGFPPGLRDQPQVLRLLHRPAGRHGGRGIPARRGQPGYRRSVDAPGRDRRSRTQARRITTAASSSSGRMDTSTWQPATGVGEATRSGARQNLEDLRGKMLRINPEVGPAGEPYTIPADNPFVGRSRGATRSGPTGSGTRGASRSTGERAT